MRSIALMVFLLAACGEDDKESVTKAVAAATAQANYSPTGDEATDDACITPENLEPLARQNPEKELTSICEQ